MKTMIIGDTHGRINQVIQRVNEDKQIGQIIHLGDMAKDAAAIKSRLPHVFVVAVDGNNEWKSHFPTELLLSVGTKKVYATHGHLYGVKRSITKLLTRAKEQGADIALFAHTHLKYEEHIEGVTLLNPSNRGYILLGEDGKYDFFHL